MATRKRRGRGEGGIYQRGDGTWCASLSLGYDGNGKRKRRTVYGMTKGEVQEKLRKLQGDASAGVLADPARQRLSDYLTHWLENVIRPNKTANTYRSYEGVVRNHIARLIGGTMLT